jgi:hypothetical protein
LGSFSITVPHEAGIFYEKTRTDTSKIKMWMCFSNNCPVPGNNLASINQKMRKTAEKAL